MERTLTRHWLTHPADKAPALAALTAARPDLAADALWAAQWPVFVQSPAYAVQLLADGQGEPLAIGLLLPVQQPLASRPGRAAHLLLAESLWVRDEAPGLVEAWAAAAMQQVAALDFEGLCLPPTGAALRLPPAVDRHPVRHEPVPLRYAAAGLYRGLRPGPSDTALLQGPAVLVINAARLDHLAGWADTTTARHFRGEGRLRCPGQWDCADLDALAGVFRRRGFPVRAPGRFDGRIDSQLLQQGYVNQPTASLSRSFEVAAMYATGGGQRPGLVFTLDAARLRRDGPVYDAFASLCRHSEGWFDAADALAFGALVRRLGPGPAGSLLARWDATARGIARQCGAFLREGGAFRPADYDDPALGPPPPALHGLLRALERHAMRSALPFAGALALEAGADGRVQEAPLRQAYAIAFDMVQARLQAAQAGAQGPQRHPGWDLTVFGYIAKTCRDEEAFSSGPVPGEAIVDVQRVEPGQSSPRKPPL